MSSVSRRGYSMVELAVALTLFGLVATATHNLVSRALATNRAQLSSMEASAAVRTALFILPLELGDLDAMDPDGGDILEMSATSIVYRSMVNLYFVCRRPEAPDEGVMVSGASWFGMQPIDAAEQSILVWVARDSAPSRDQWLAFSLRNATAGRDCPGGRSSLFLDLTGGRRLSPSLVPVGTPVRAYRIVNARLYRDSDGWYWLGMRTRDSNGEWGITQPVLGPLAPDGIRFEYFDLSGAELSDPARVARIRIRVGGGSSWTRPDAPSRVTGETDVWLRNNPRG